MSDVLSLRHILNHVIVDMGLKCHIADVIIGKFKLYSFILFSPTGHFLKF